MEFNNHRRQFIRHTTQLAVGGALGGFLVEVNAEETDKGVYETSVDTEDQCATCGFWGGIRKVSKDGKTVITQSVGWCNNPESPNYHNLTAPDTGPMKLWRKWGILVQEKTA
jgi:anaerobic selenocysteine-containing dehydrogenase